MRPVTLLPLIALLAACGADGRPVPPAGAATAAPPPSAAATGATITLSGDARFGLVRQ